MIHIYRTVKTDAFMCEKHFTDLAIGCGVHLIYITYSLVVKAIKCITFLVFDLHYIARSIRSPALTCI